MRDSSGPSGQVRCGYQVAAELGCWEYWQRGVIGREQPGGPWAVAAEIVKVDEFWLAHASRLDLLLDLADGRRLRWRGVVLIPGGNLLIHGEGEAEHYDS